MLFMAKGPNGVGGKKPRAGTAYIISTRRMPDKLRPAGDGDKSAKCESGDLNPDPFRDWILSPARLPIPPPSQRKI